MKKWFEIKVKYFKKDENGDGKNVSEVYLLDAVSFTEAEARIIKQMEAIVPSIDGSEKKKGPSSFLIKAIKKSNIIELFPYDIGEWWFRIIVDMVTLDEAAGKEKHVKENYLIMADDIEQALTRIKKSLDSTIVPYVVTSISVSNIIDVFNYTEA